jgi:ribonucleoside-diphosphate reductase alpha chain
MSVNTSYNPKFFPQEEIPESLLLGHVLLAYKLGIKTLYYNNTADGAGEININVELKPSVVDDSECDSCKI